MAKTGGRVYPGADLTVRDYFAAAALPAMVEYYCHMNLDANVDRLALISYRIADAMLKARE